MSPAGNLPWQRIAFAVAVVCSTAASVWAYNHQNVYYDFPAMVGYLIRSAFLFDGSSSDAAIIWVTRIGLTAAAVRIAGRAMLAWVLKPSS